MAKRTRTSRGNAKRPGAASGRAKAPASSRARGRIKREIVIRGARQHNLQNIDVRIPRDKMVVITGLSGSGKSSLAFDTIYAEGQRKYVESLSAYARQFLEQLGKPEVDHIEGLPPTVAIEQRARGSNPRSTVATTTEIYDYLRLLFARVGEPHCWVRLPRGRLCNRPITSQTVSQIVDAIFTLPEGTRFMVLAPIVRGQKGQHTEMLRHVQREGFIRVRIDGSVYDLKNLPEPAKNKKHSIEVVVDRLVLKDSARIRLSESIETALSLAGGLVIIMHEAAGGQNPSPEAGGDFAGWKDRLFSTTYACPKHPEANLPELAPRMFSFNSPYGACESCDGLGTILEFDPDLIVPDPSLSLSQGAIDAWRHGGKRMNIFYNRLIRRFCIRYKVPANVPFKELRPSVRKKLMYGDGDKFEGVVPNLMRRWRKTESQFVKARMHSFLSEQPCRTCEGARLKAASLAVTVGEKNLHQITQMSI
ncbi:MAG: hypothetical protein ISS78_08235, partial [Phycisphaerae bacterium]|nr:hypothetical protein [Phycisphaerae bacterium]